ncbi:MAG TPA: hypothetical protein VL742_02275 [Casimicrobiaceae bacterium]|nr:hypothetical protein [Casimicrobiaceae bacterium]
MRRCVVFLGSLAVALAAPAAWATFHTYQIDEMFSNADGTVQYVVLHEAAGANGQNFLAGHTLTSTSGGATQTYVFPTNLPGDVNDGYGIMEAPTAFTRVLIATQGFAALGIVTPDYVIPDGFLPLANGTVNYAEVDQVTYTSLPTDGVTAIKRTGAVAPNVATNYAGASASVSAAVANYEGLWWNAPASSESGWGINFEHQGDIIFATWFTYDATGKGWWLVMTAPKTGPNTYSGTLFRTMGPAFNAVPFNPMQVTPTQVGNGTLTFTDANNGTFAYTVNGISQVKSITREVFGPLPTCTSGVANLGATGNYQGLWWAAPGGSESGWGINFAHEGDTIFATWFTYDLDGTPMWLVVTAQKTEPGSYAGTLFRTTGPAFNAVPFNPASVTPTAVGTATLTFTDGNTGRFAYTVNGVSQAKAITRQVFGSGTTCQ